MRCPFLVSLLIFLLVAFISKAQIPINAWRTHFSYRSVNDIALATDMVYASTENGIFFYNTSDQSLGTLNKNNGLNDTGISKIKFNNSKNQLFIGYKNGNLDIKSGNKIQNLPVMKNASINRSKEINDFTFSGDSLFISTDMGLLFFLASPEQQAPYQIIESYTQLGVQGKELGVNKTLIIRDSLFLATEEGLIAAPLAPDINRMDFANWRRFGQDDGTPSVTINEIAIWQNQLYSAIDGEGIYKYDGKDWKLAFLEKKPHFTSLQTNRNHLLITTRDSIFEASPSGPIQNLPVSGIKSPTSIKLDNKGSYWIGDSKAGLFSDIQGNFKAIIPNGPVSNNTGRLHLVLEDKIIAHPPAFDDNFQPFKETSGFSLFRQEEWQVFTNENQEYPSVPPRAFYNISGSVYSKTTGKIYLISYQNGILTIDEENNLAWVDKADILEKLNLAESNDTSLQLTSMAIDNQSRLWLTNYNSDYPLLSWNLSNGSWQKYAFQQNDARFPLEVIFQQGYFWVRLAPFADQQVLVFDPENNRVRFLSGRRDQGNFPGNVVASLTLDHNQNMWIGTNEGIGVLSQTKSIFDIPAVNAIRPIIDNQYLLRDETVTAIQVDGGNRKWVGTDNGIWLFNQDGTRLIQHFTIDDSPLPSNKINDISLLPGTGEVFIATPSGMVSFRSNATEPATSHNQVKIFPNPVNPDFNGTVVIEGLPENAEVRITTVSGSFVKKLPVNGGTASWDVKNHQGQKVGTGIYLIFSATGDGEDTFVGKIAVIN